MTKSTPRTAGRRRQAQSVPARQKRASTPQQALRSCLAITVLAAPLVYTRASSEAFAVVELTAIVLGALAVVAVGAATAVATARVRLPYSEGVAAAAVLLLAFCLATVTADRPLAAILGQEGRSSGLMLYIGCLVVFVGILFLEPPVAGARIVLSALLAGGSAVTLVGALQWTGMDLLGAEEQLGTTIVGTLGNPNFASAYMGLTVPVGMWGALHDRWPRWARAAAAFAAALALAVSAASDSVQGPIAALAGASVVVFALIRMSGERVRRALTVAWSAAVVLPAALVVLGLRGLGPLRSVLDTETFAFRKHYWSAAARVGWDHPWLGVGIDRFAGYYRQYRSDAATAHLGSSNLADAAHDVPLQMWANGGIILTLAYLGFILVVAWRLVVGLARIRDREHLLLLGGAGGVWVAYQTQSLVSIDQPPLALVHFVAAGLIIVLSGNLHWREVTISPLVRRRSGNPVRTGAAVAAALVVVGAGYLVTSPLRSNLRLHDGNVATDKDDALEAYADADAELLSGAAPGYQASLVWVSLGRREDAIRALQGAIAKEPRERSYRLHLAALLVAEGRHDEAQAQIAAAVELDPRGVTPLTDAGTLLLAMDKNEEALEVLQRATAIPDATAGSYAGLGEALRRLGREDEARDAYTRALELDPNNSQAKTALEELVAEE